MSKEAVIPKFPKELIKYILILIGLTVILIYFTLVVKVDLKTIAIIIGFILLGAFSRLPQRMSPFSFGVELCTLFTISAAILYGSIAGVIVGVFSFGISGVYTKEPPTDVIVAIIGFALIGYFATSFYNYFGDLGMAALAITALYDLGTNLVYFLLGHNIVSCLRFSAMHVPSNYLILKYLGPKIISL